MDRHHETTQLMERELEDALGEEAGSGEARAATQHQPRTVPGLMRENRLLIGITAAVVLVLGAMLGLALDSPVFVLIALAVHLVATYFVAIFAIRLAGNVEKPDPVTVARLQAEGVADPEMALNDAVKAHAGADHALTEDSESADDNPSRAAAQGGAMTPSSVPTELVGPGSKGSLSA